MSQYKYFIIDEIEHIHEGEVRRQVVKKFKERGKIVVNLQKPQKTHYALPDELINNLELGAYITLKNLSGYDDCTIPKIVVYDSEGKFLTESVGPNCGLISYEVKATITQLFSREYIPPRMLVKSQSNELDGNDNKVLDIRSEKSIRNFLDENGAEEIEGIWQYQGDANYKLFIQKDDYKYVATVIEKEGRFEPGDKKADFEPAAVNDVYSVKWTMGDKRTIRKTVTTVQKDALMEINIGTKAFLYKVYPSLDAKPKKIKPRTGEWAGNGSGIIISKSGYIVTNYHVIDDADKIEVEFILNGEVQKFNAEVVQVDKVNDLAIIKIFDMNFDGVDELPYNFKSRSSDVGTTIYAYGYPMALTAMGKEVKVTDGIINAKSGFDGDITTYQISAPIQGGNSGGPLFDDKGNFIGINSAVIRKDIADNVGYTIKSSYVLNLIDVLPKNIDLPSSSKLESLPLIEQIKEISKYVVLIKIK